MIGSPERGKKVMIEKISILVKNGQILPTYGQIMATNGQILVILEFSQNIEKKFSKKNI